MQSTNGSGQLPQQQQQPETVVEGGMAAQQWMAMQYPAVAMVMQQQMMQWHYPSPHYMAAYHPQPYMQPPSPHYCNQQQQRRNGGVNKTIWVGDLHDWMDEHYLHNCFVSTGEIANIKLIRNKHTGLSEGYGFVEFFSHATADKVLQSYVGLMMPNTEQPFNLNWATFSTSDKRADNGSDHSIFVGDLSADVSDNLLHETFVSKYPSVKAAKVVIDGNTGRSKGYGFVRFGDDNERAQAMTEMNGVYCSTRPMRIGAATPKNLWVISKIFIGGLDPNVADEDLRQHFSQYGEIVSVKIPIGKGCGFVQFANRSNAEEALQMLNGKVIGEQTVRLSWGRNPANKQMRRDFSSQQNGASYYGRHIYDRYGYALPQPHDPSNYAAAAYGPYPTHGDQ